MAEHPSYNSEDNLYQLSREDQVIMVRPRTGHCRLRQHLHKNLHIGDTYMCHCGMARMTVEHLQDCTTHQNERKATPVKTISLAYWRICSAQRPSEEEPGSLSERSTKKKKIQ